MFLLNELEKELDTIGIIDGIVGRAARETGPTIGEYFFYAWMNRLAAPRSKRALSDWYRHTAIQEIRDIDLSELSSQRYRDKWDRLSVEDIAGTGIVKFSPLDIEGNLDRGEGDRMVAFRTRMELWGSERTVIVTHNPRTARKRACTLERKLDSIRETLLEIRVNRDRHPEELLSGKTILEEMSSLDSVWMWYPDRKKPERMMESPTKTQSAVLRSFGWEIISGGVLQKLSP